MNQRLFKEFLRIAEQLNRVDITPLLMGSLGLEYVTKRSWNVGDIDIHVPGDPRGWYAPDEERIYQFDAIQLLMEQLGYQLVDRHEHEFVQANVHVEFGAVDTLPEFAGVAIEELDMAVVDGVTFYVPNVAQYLAIYQASSKDSYRNEQNNDKDFAKIAYLEELVEKDERTN